MTIRIVSRPQVPMYAALTAVMFLGACTEDLSNPTEPTLERRLMTTAEHRTMDDELVDLARRVRGFAGFFYDADGTMAVRLVDTSSFESVQGELAVFLDAGSASLIPTQLRVLPARYDFIELNRFRDQVTPLLANRNVTQWDIDELRNRLVIGVTDEQSRGYLRQRLAAMDLPEDAVDVQIIAPTNVSATVQDRVRPVYGGLRIVHGSTLANCSLGVNAYRDGSVPGTYYGRFFITAGHCSGDLGHTTNSAIYQPNPLYLIGVEIFNPPTFTFSEVSACPPGDRCRYSDALLAVLADSVTWWHGRFVRISSGLTIHAFAPFYDIAGTDANYDLYLGQQVAKVGSTTGYTAGNVSATCVNVRQFTNGIPTDRVLICQMQAGYIGSDGDSGAPVYRHITGGPTLLGIHWGSSSAPPQTSTFSRFYSVAAELSQDGGGYPRVIRNCCN